MPIPLSAGNNESDSMQESPRRSREILVYTCVFAICILFLLFIFFFVSYRCGQILAEGGPGCVVDDLWYALSAMFLIIALFALYRVNGLMGRRS